MFIGDFRESREEEVTIGEISGGDLQCLVHYCYTGEIELREETSLESAMTLLSAANRLQLNGVVNACGTFLKHHLDATNCLELAEFAERHSCDTLLTFAQDYIDLNFLQVIENQEFVQLSAEELGKLLARDYLNVPSEEDVFHALLTWFRHDSEKRENCIPSLLAHIRIHQLQPEFIIDHVKPLCESSNCQDLVMKAFEWQLVPARRADESKLEARGSAARKLISVRFDGNSDCHVVEEFCPKTKNWTFSMEIGVNRSCCGMAMMDNKIIFIGGRHEGYARCEVYSFDVKTKTLQTLSPMLRYQSECCTAVLNGFLYVFGGRNEESLNTVERLDPSTGTWNEETPMTICRYFAEAVAFDGQLFVIGGCDEQFSLNSVERYNPNTKEWSHEAPMVKHRYHIGVTATKDHIYVFGGYNGNDRPLSCVERYDPKADEWTIVATLNVNPGYIGVTCLGENILCVGSINTDSKTVELFHPDTNTTSELTHINCCKRSWSSCSVCILALVSDKDF
ncbi:kelch-like protein 1 [Phlebotomus argentipes]|uniref:kelch-like protein 1 n=1 Tax=Phlebotomus argentipes TaxID=94469 RepID=UPI002892FA3F|nr:kelch-like protein 1 [Phlebotomus argentipes]XP_059617044.1 kelch-like protein 1 [Phlebotomus argentipes]